MGRRAPFTAKQRPAALAVTRPGGPPDRSSALPTRANNPAAAPTNYWLNVRTKEG